jgi:hypothetical protein
VTKNIKEIKTSHSIKRMKRIHKTEDEEGIKENNNIKVELTYLYIEK